MLSFTALSAVRKMALNSKKQLQNNKFIKYRHFCRSLKLFRDELFVLSNFSYSDKNTAQVMLTQFNEYPYSISLLELLAFS